MAVIEGCVCLHSCPVGQGETTPSGTGVHRIGATLERNLPWTRQVTMAVPLLNGLIRPSPGRMRSTSREPLGSVRSKESQAHNEGRRMGLGAGGRATKKAHTGEGMVVGGGFWLREQSVPRCDVGRGCCVCVGDGQQPGG